MYIQVIIPSTVGRGIWNEMSLFVCGKGQKNISDQKVKKTSLSKVQRSKKHRWARFKGQKNISNLGNFVCAWKRLAVSGAPEGLRRTTGRWSERFTECTFQVELQTEWSWMAIFYSFLYAYVSPAVVLKQNPASNDRLCLDRSQSRVKRVVPTSVTCLYLDLNYSSDE